jgi:hypothetical protein
MTSHRIRTRTTALLSAMMLAVALSGPVVARCDSMGGPAKWVRAEDEELIRKNHMDHITRTAPATRISRSNKLIDEVAHAGALYFPGCVEV